MAVKIVSLIIAAIAVLGIILVALIAVAIQTLSKYMKERDKKHENWIDPRNDRTY